MWFAGLSERTLRAVPERLALYHGVGSPQTSVQLLRERGRRNLEAAPHSMGTRSRERTLFRLSEREPDMNRETLALGTSVVISASFLGLSTPARSANSSNDAAKAEAEIRALYKQLIDDENAHDIA